MSIPLPKISLHYFDQPGRAEAIRLVLHIGGIPFEDVRFSSAEWPAIKPTTPFGNCPWIEVDGKRLAQSNAILLFVGRLTNLLPICPFEEAKVMELLEAVEDVVHMLAPSLQERDSAKQLAMREALIKSPGSFTNYLKKLNDILLASGGQYFVGSQLTVADIKMFWLLSWFESGMLSGIPVPFIAENCPALHDFTTHIGKHPKITEWNATHRSSTLHG